MKILVTGAYGQLGNEIKAITNKFPDWKFLFTDIDSLDITNEIDVQVFLQKNAPDFIINCAAYTAVDKAESDPENAGILNELAPGILAGCAKKENADFIHISSDYVFDGESFTPYQETSEVNPKSVYGKSKLNGELRCFEENPRSMVIRTSWLYSAFGNNFVKTMLRLGNERGRLNVVFDQVGTPTYAADLAFALLSIVKMAGENAEKFVPGVYHYSNEGVASWYDFAKAIFEMSGINCEVFPVRSEEYPTPARRPSYSVLDKAKIKKTFNLNIPYWKDSLQICIQKLK